MSKLVTLNRRKHVLAQPERQIGLLEQDLQLAGQFEQALERSGLWPLWPRSIDVLQVNLGRVCNQACAHCHVDAGPDRTESMSLEVMERVLEVFEQNDISTLDITGGAPELHPHFRQLVLRARKVPKRKIMVRSNLTVLMTRPLRDMPAFLAEQRVEIVASLPHYRETQTDRQRGEGVFEISLAAIKVLNDLGYGQEGSGLILDLMSNPVGAFLPGGQGSLEKEWKREMERLYGLRFNRLFVLTNMPISRYLDFLVESGNLEPYMGRLVRAFNPSAAQQVMCRSMLSVGWDGRLFDCDFNQMLDLGLEAGLPSTIFDFEAKALLGRKISVKPHCFGCTAGAGSSCGGQTESAS